MKILRGAIHKGLFNGELRYFFNPSNECQCDFVAHSHEKLDLLVFVLLYLGIKIGYEKFSFTFPDALDVTYPVIVEGNDVRAVHSPTISEQMEVATMVEMWRKESEPYFQVKKLQQKQYH